MEMLPLFIYLAGIVNQINITMTIISALLLAAVVGLVFYLMEQEKSKVDPHIIEAGWKFCKKTYRGSCYLWNYQLASSTR